MPGAPSTHWRMAPMDRDRRTSSADRGRQKYFGLDNGQSEIDSASDEVFAGFADSAETMSTQSSACR